MTCKPYPPQPRGYSAMRIHQANSPVVTHPYLALQMSTREAMRLGNREGDLGGPRNTTSLESGVGGVR